MSDQNISCPKCGTQIQLNDALTEQIRHQLEGELGKELKLKEQELETKSQHLIKMQKSVDDQVAQKLETEKVKMWQLAQEKAAEKLNLELKDLKEASREKDNQIEKCVNKN